MNVDLQIKTKCKKNNTLLAELILVSWQNYIPIREQKQQYKTTFLNCLESRITQ